MEAVRLLLKAYDSAFWELGESLTGMPDEDVWKRADPALLSVGELAAHIAYWEAQSCFGDAMESALFAGHKRYYPDSVQQSVDSQLGAQAMVDELGRVHTACRGIYASLGPDLGTPNPHREGWSWEYTLIYVAFHLAYHAGQIYSVRHLLGHQTVDN